MYFIQTKDVRSIYVMWLGQRSYISTQHVVAKGIAEFPAKRRKT
jgi:hypothetical protein